LLQRQATTGAFPTGDAIAAWRATGHWLDGAALEAWCHSHRRAPGRQWVLIALCAGLGLISTVATQTGLAMLLPSIALSVCSALLLFALTTALSGGWVMQDYPVRRTGILAVLTVVSVVTGFPAYFHSVAGQAEQSRGEGLASAAHAELVARIVAPALSEAAQAEGEAAAAWELAAAEASGKVGTGRAGVGPEARRLQDSARNAERIATATRATADRLETASAVADDARFTDLYESALAIWAAGEPGTRGAQPERAQFIDPAQESSFFLPFVRLLQLDARAWMVFLLIACGIDGLNIFMSASVVRRRSSGRVDLRRPGRVRRPGRRVGSMGGCSSRTGGEAEWRTRRAQRLVSRPNIG